MTGPRSPALTGDWQDVEAAARSRSKIHSLPDGGLAVLMVSHHPDAARHIDERTAFVQGGRILEMGETDRALGASRSPELRAYLGDAPG